MKLYYTDPQCQIYCGDAQNLDAIKDKSVNLVCLDAPYGINYVSGHRTESFEPIISDSNFPYTLLKNTFYECHRVLRSEAAIYIFCQFNTYPKLLPIVQEVFDFRNLLVWVKNNWSGGELETNYARQYELIVYATVKGRKHKLRGARPTNVLLFKRVEGKELLHPTEKPVPLLAYLISKSSDPGDIVLDPMMGSGSTLEAAVQIGRKAVGVEIEERFCKVARERLCKHFLPLFNTVGVAGSNFQLEF